MKPKAPPARRALLALVLAPALASACTAPTPESPWERAAFRSQALAVVEAHAAAVEADYRASRDAAADLQAAVDAFVAAPSADGLEAARSAWLAAREPYLRTEVHRFYGGPIDAIEGQINAWPLDEVYIDYVEGEPDGGIINDPAGTPTIDADALIAANEALGEDTISIGWHAIEFLLWGQDHDPAGPGDRPYTDFVDGPEGSAANPDRRRAYLAVVSALLVADLTTVVDAWAPGDAGYRADFLGDDPKASITKILLGMGSLSGAELAGERMTVAFETREQEDEHSCFSDNTHRDLLGDALGIQAAYVGGDGEPGVSSLVAMIDPDLDARLRSELQASVDAIAAIPPPFDQAIQAADGEPAREAVRAAIDALRTQTATIAEVAAVLEIQLNLEE
ncbi:MAG: iron-regulated protein [Myxococcales bacterium]|nr:iron-regulated protein [Myxococcales bacterium]